MDFSDVLQLGTTLEYVRNSDYGTHEVKGKGWLVDMLVQLSALIVVCEIEDEWTLESIEKWIRRLNRTYKKGQSIKKQLGKELSDDANAWQDLIYKELCSRPCIEFQKGALNQRALVRISDCRASNIFETKVWRALPKIARSDYSDAAKCLLIGASTPATMVALRGMESVIRKYYSLKTKQPAGKKKSWGYYWRTQKNARN